GTASDQPTRSGDTTFTRRVKDFFTNLFSWGVDPSGRSSSLETEAPPLTAARALDAPARELRQDRVPVHAEPPGRVAHVPAHALEHAQNVLALELFQGFARRRARVLA